MWVNIIADASYCPDTNTGGYGFWISSERGKEGGNGILPGIVYNNFAAELMAIIKGVEYALKKRLLITGDALLIQTDCQAAICALENKRIRISTQEFYLTRDFKALTKGIFVEYRHVKGHSREKGDRFKANKICDVQARTNMKRARRKHYQKFEPEQLTLDLEIS